VILVAVACLFLRARPPQEAAGQTLGTNQQWEYQLVNVEPWKGRGEAKSDTEAMARRFTEEFNNLAAGGWEYVGQAPGFMSFGVFRRPKR
jgi:hypothetical protein